MRSTRAATRRDISGRVAKKPSDGLEPPPPPYREQKEGAIHKVRWKRLAPVFTAKRG